MTRTSVRVVAFVRPRPGPTKRPLSSSSKFPCCCSGCGCGCESQVPRLVVLMLASTCFSIPSSSSPSIPSRIATLCCFRPPARAAWPRSLLLLLGAFPPATRLRPRASFLLMAAERWS
uniref:Uncharacterized protein n=1 Tax=Oryza punctata TaxID=4537 RepID=A0A0E0MB69_ORYPU